MARAPREDRRVQPQGATVSSRLAPEDLVERVRLIDVDGVELLPGNPNEGDVGAIHLSMEEFGQVETILVADVDGTTRVVNGNHRVIAERQARRFGGKLAAIDVTGLGWDDVRGIAAGLALNHTSRLGRDDDALLADALKRLLETDEALLAAASYDTDYIDLLLARTDGATDPLREWAGMPAFNQENRQGIFHVHVHFLTDADADAFFEMIDRPKRQSMWWPQDDGLHDAFDDVFVVEENT